MYKNNWINDFNKYDNKKVLLMLSGGKDSSACLHILKKENIDVTAVHFTHKWGYEISTQEARKLCERLNVPLIEIDFSEEYFNAIAGYKGGRPCLLCKPKMYEKVIQELSNNDYGWVCIGDNADDRTTINRMQDYIKDRNESIHCNTYFGSERGVVLPKNIKILRPLLELKSTSVENYLNVNGINIKKNNSTGDKYFEYAREGCPVQFHDPGFKITRENMDDLKKYNLLISEFAKANNIRASIHLPSTFIITIPTGFEKKAGKYLEGKGLKIDWNINEINNLDKKRILIRIKNINKEIYNNDIQEILFERMIERLEFKVKNKEVYKDLYCYNLNEGLIEFKCSENLELLSIDFIMETLIEKNRLENLIVEIFRSRNYSIMREV